MLGYVTQTTQITNSDKKMIRIVLLPRLPAQHVPFSLVTCLPLHLVHEAGVTTLVPHLLHLT